MNDRAGISYRRTESPRDAIWDAIKNQPLFTFADRRPLKSRGVPGVAVFDFDRDGGLDIYVANGPGTSNSLYSSQLKETGEMQLVDARRVDQSCPAYRSRRSHRRLERRRFHLAAGAPVGHVFAAGAIVRWIVRRHDTAHMWSAFTPVDPTDPFQCFTWNGFDPADRTLSVEINGAENDNGWVKVNVRGNVSFGSKKKKAGELFL